MGGPDGDGAAAGQRPEDAVAVGIAGEEVLCLRKVTAWTAAAKDVDRLRGREDRWCRWEGFLRHGGGR